MELGTATRGQKNYSDGATTWSKKYKDRFSCLDIIPSCDGQTPYDGNDCAVQSVARVKNKRRLIDSEVQKLSEMC